MSAVPPAGQDIEQQRGANPDTVPQSGWSSWRWFLASPSRDAADVVLMGDRTSKISENRSSHTATDVRNAALEALFGLSTTHIAEWPGLLAFFHHLESCFQQLLDPCFAPAWKLLGRDAPSTPVDVWHFCFAVIDAYESSRDDDPSIKQIHERMRGLAHAQATPSGDTPPPTQEDNRHAMQAIFAVLCWMSATLKPALGDPAMEPGLSSADSDVSDEESPLIGRTALCAENCSHIYSSTDPGRPTAKMFGRYRFRAADADNRGSDGATAAAGHNSSEDILYESSLSYISLSTTGLVRIKWVDTLTAHLAFDYAARELSVFRYPSFCATKILSTRKVKVLENITKMLLPRQTSAPSSNESDSVYREALLSYRLLFGQSGKSRKVLSRILDRPPSDPAAHPSRNNGHIHKDELDSFIETLCTSPLRPRRRFPSLGFGRRPAPQFRGELFPLSALSVDNELIESDTYSAREDFPTFGPRLLALQRYNMRRRPSKIKDMWRDRRNPLQWYTFWAVLGIGGVGVLLSLAQLAIGIAQIFQG